MPLMGVHTVADQDLNVLEFIEESYQPIMVRGAVKKSTVSNLEPWTFPALLHGVQAATTFCVVSPSVLATEELEECAVGKCEYEGELLQKTLINHASLCKISLYTYL